MTKFLTREAPELKSFVDERLQRELEPIYYKFKNELFKAEKNDIIWGFILIYGKGILNKINKFVPSPFVSVAISGLSKLISWQAKKSKVEQKGF